MARSLAGIRFTMMASSAARAASNPGLILSMSPGTGKYSGRITLFTMGMEIWKRMSWGNRPFSRRERKMK